MRISFRLLETRVREETILDDVLVHFLEQGQVLARVLELLLVDHVEGGEAPIVRELGIVVADRAHELALALIVLLVEALVQIVAQQLLLIVYRVVLICNWPVICGDH